jgi:hypothetical protein
VAAAAGDRPAHNGDAGGVENVGNAGSIGNVGRDVNFTFFNNQFRNPPGASEGDRGVESPTRSGRVGAAELDALRTMYVIRPVDGELQAALAADRLVLLQGRSGWGRRSAALRSLAAVTDDRVNVLDAADLTMVRDASYAPDEGYLFDARAIQASHAMWSDATFDVLRSRVVDAGAYLVILLPEGASHDLPCRFTWSRIGDHELLAGAGLEDVLAEEDVARLLGAGAAVADVARLLAHVGGARGAGTSVEDAIDSFSGSRRAQIRDRLDAVVERDEVVVLTCLCFLGGTSETAFDTGQLDLLDALSRDDDEEERKRTRIDRFAPTRGLLARCDGQQSVARRNVARLQVDVPVIDFQVPAHAPDYVAEFWRSRPNAFRREIVLWLRRFLPKLVSDDLVAAADRLALLADVDFLLLITEILQIWADGDDPYEALLAAGVLQIVAERGRGPEAVQVASQWARGPLGSSQLLAATYFFAFTAVDHPENALVLFRRKSLREPSGLTRQTALDGWKTLAVAATERADTARTLTRYLASLEAVRKGEVDDPVFALLDRWFAGDRRHRPLALGAAAHGPECERHVAAVLGSVAAKTRARLDWYRPLVGYLDSPDAATTELSGRLIDQSLRPLVPVRREFVVTLLLERIRRWNRDVDGPSRAATELAERIIRSHYPRRLS